MPHKQKLLLLTSPENEARDLAGIRQQARSHWQIFLGSSDPVMSAAELHPDLIVYRGKQTDSDWHYYQQAAELTDPSPQIITLDDARLGSWLSEGVPPGLQQEFPDAGLLAAIMDAANRYRGLIPFVSKITDLLGHQSGILVFRESSSARWIAFAGRESQLAHGPELKAFPALPFVSDRFLQPLIPSGTLGFVGGLTAVLPVIRAGSHLSWILFPDQYHRFSAQVLGTLQVAVHGLLYRTERPAREAKRKISTTDLEKDTFGVTINRGGHIRAVHPQLAAQLGYLPSEILGRRYFDFVSPRYRQDMVKTHLRLMSNEQNNRPFDIILSTAYQQELVFEARVTPEDEAANRFVVDLVEVTGIRDSAVQARRQLEILETLVDINPQPLLAADRRGRITLYNRAAETLLGWPRDQILSGKIPVTRLYPDDTAHKLFASLRNDYAEGGSGQTAKFRTTLVSQDGSKIPVRVAAALIFDESHEPIGSVGVYEDRSELHRARAEQVLPAEDMIKDAQDQVVRRLAGATGHRLNQPLQALQTTLEMLEMSLDAPKQRDRLGKALGYIEELREMIKKLSATKSYETTSYGEHTEILSIADDEGTLDG